MIMSCTNNKYGSSWLQRESPSFRVILEKLLTMELIKNNNSFRSFVLKLRSVYQIVKNTTVMKYYVCNVRKKCIFNAFLTLIAISIICSLHKIVHISQTYYHETHNSINLSTIGIQSKFEKQLLHPDFQKIGNGEDKLYVYSAFYDDQWAPGVPSVTVLAGLKTLDSTPLYCVFFDFEGIRRTETVEATQKNIHVILDKDYPCKYSAYFLVCNVTNFPGNVPSFVAIVESPQEKSTTNLIAVATKSKTKKYKFALCLQPLYDFDDAFQLVEWIEYNRMMGVDKFIFYNVSIGPEATCVIKSYGDVIQTLNWNSPYKFSDDLLTHAQGIALNDCLQRCKGESEHMVAADVDEMLMPSPALGNNFQEMIFNLEKYAVTQNRSLEKISDYSFRNGMFFLHWNNNTDVSQLQIPGGTSQENSVIKKLALSKFVLRIKELGIPSMRAKYIAYPDRVMIAATHYTASTMADFDEMSSKATFYVSEVLAYNHHYRRTCELDIDGIDRSCEKDKILDNSAHRFAKNVTLRLVERLNTHIKHCNITIP